MSNLPTLIGLLVCENAIIERDTANLSLINCFTTRKAATFPTEPQRFAVVAFLTDGEGSVPLDLVVTGLETLEEMARYSHVVSFHDRLQEVRFVFRVNALVFPEAGDYDICLFSKSELLAQHRIHIG